MITCSFASFTSISENTTTMGYIIILVGIIIMTEIRK